MNASHELPIDDLTPISNPTETEIFTAPPKGESISHTHQRSDNHED